MSNLDINWEGVLVEIQRQREIDDTLPSVSQYLSTRVTDGSIINHSLMYAHISQLPEELLLSSERRARDNGATHRIVHRDHLKPIFGGDLYLEVEFLGVSRDGTSGTIFPGSYQIRLVSQTLQQSLDGVFTIIKQIASPNVPSGSRFLMSNLTNCNIHTPQG